MKKLNQKAFSEQIEQYDDKSLFFALGHIFLEITQRFPDADDISCLKDWCSKTIDSALGFHKKKNRS